MKLQNKTSTSISVGLCIEFYDVVLQIAIRVIKLGHKQNVSLLYYFSLTQ